MDTHRTIRVGESWVSGASAETRTHTVSVTVEIGGDILTDTGLGLAIRLLERKRNELRNRKLNKADRRTREREADSGV